MSKHFLSFCQSVISLSVCHFSVILSVCLVYLFITRFPISSFESIPIKNYFALNVFSLVFFTSFVLLHNVKLLLKNLFSDLKIWYMFVYFFFTIFFLNVQKFYTFFFLLYSNSAFARRFYCCYFCLS